MFIKQNDENVNLKKVGIKTSILGSYAMGLDSSLFTMPLIIQYMGLISFICVLVFSYLQCIFTSRLIIKSIDKSGKYIRTYDELALIARGK